jgi:charged multivesicular body protein 4
MLEKKERFLQKKCSAEIEKAKDYTKPKNKNDKQALPWRKRKLICQSYMLLQSYENFSYRNAKLADLFAC